MLVLLPQTWGSYQLSDYLGNRCINLLLSPLFAIRTTMSNAKNALRPNKERNKTAYGKQYDYRRMQCAKKDVNAMLGEQVETPQAQ